jgi:hypothetical protein
MVFYLLICQQGRGGIAASQTALQHIYSGNKPGTATRMPSSIFVQSELHINAIGHDNC